MFSIFNGPRSAPHRSIQVPERPPQVERFRAFHSVWSSSRDDAFVRHCAIGQQIANATPFSFCQYANTLDPDRRLKVAIVGTKYQGPHPVRLFTNSFLHYLDYDKIDCRWYKDFPDAYTGSNWVDFAQTLKRQQFDIIIDPEGLINRGLDVFAFRPAPIQVTYLGYPHSTGLTSINYRLTDALADPEECSTPATEQLWRMPRSFLCVGADAAPVPAVSAPPCVRRGYVTFGVFNGPHKYVYDDEVLGAWAGILRAIPNARLVLRYGKMFLALRPVYKALRQAGLDMSRVRIAWLPNLTRKGFLQHYDEVDISLDPFVYHGTTTTCDSLLMNVPVVTRVGDRHVSRVGRSILTHVNLADLVAETTDEYVNIATQLARNTQRLCALRSSLRHTLLTSPLGDAQAFAQDFERALRGMWVRYCRQLSPAQATAPAPPTPRSQHG